MVSLDVHQASSVGTLRTVHVWGLQVTFGLAHASLLLRVYEGLAAQACGQAHEQVGRRDARVHAGHYLGVADALHASVEGRVALRLVREARVVADVVLVAAGLEVRVRQRRCRQPERLGAAAVRRTLVQGAWRGFQRVRAAELAVDVLGDVVLATSSHRRGTQDEGQQ